MKGFGFVSLKPQGRGYESNENVLCRVYSTLSRHNITKNKQKAPSKCERITKHNARAPSVKREQQAHKLLSVTVIKMRSLQEIIQVYNTIKTITSGQIKSLRISTIVEVILISQRNVHDVPVTRRDSLRALRIHTKVAL